MRKIKVCQSAPVKYTYKVAIDQIEKAITLYLLKVYK